ncbi:DUF5655 domain-containing protein [Microbacterium sp. LBN7]|uniref:DUF5655 domain-containing protein n=1 Tax=Microbacterium sp. LBN7 TaxID=3129773 RepID=UPI003253B368
MARPVIGETFFASNEKAIPIYRSLARPLVALDGVNVVVSRSQVALRARRAFAYAWDPSRYVKSTAPLVVSIALREKLSSSRFKEVVHVSPRTWMHHAELRSVADVDDELIGWLKRACEEAR